MEILYPVLERRRWRWTAPLEEAGRFGTWERPAWAPTCSPCPDSVYWPWESLLLPSEFWLPLTCRSCYLESDLSQLQMCPCKPNIFSLDGAFWKVVHSQWNLVWSLFEFQRRLTHLDVWHFNSLHTRFIPWPIQDESFWISLILIKGCCNYYSLLCNSNSETIHAHEKTSQVVHADWLGELQ